MKKYKGGARPHGGVIFFCLVFIFLAVFLRRALPVSASIFASNIEGIPHVPSVTIPRDGLPAYGHQCNPLLPEGAYTRAWDLKNWLINHAPEETTLRNIYTTQKGNPDPAPFVGLNWPREIAQFRQAWSAFVGPIPQSCTPLNVVEYDDLGLTPTELAHVNTSSYEMKKISYRGAHGEPIPAFLFIPHSIRPGDKVPAILVMHQSLAVCGKKEPAGVCDEGTPWLNFAQDFAEKGYVTLAPDSIGYGERSEYFDDYGLEYADAAPLLSRFPSSTLMGLRISDVMRGVDYLQTLPYVDGNRIGMMGHSNGGVETLFNAAFDTRIKCAVSNAGPNLIRRETYGWAGWSPGVTRWGAWAYMPAFGFFDKDVKNLPIETHQLYVMVAPRGLFVSVMEDDSVAPNFDRAQFAMDQAKRAFDAVGGDFAYHIIKSGLTPENRTEWGAPGCMMDTYAECEKNGDSACLMRFASVGITPACITNEGGVEYCTHDVWEQCLATSTEAICDTRFASVGVTDSCIEEAFQKYSRRDHGWYPETEAEAYPWMEKCLKK